MESIFVVSAGMDYEGSTPIRAFATKAEADEFAQACQQYENTRPPLFRDDDEASIAAWSAALEEWRRAHVGGEQADGADYFSVDEIPFAARPSPPREKQ